MNPTGTGTPQAGQPAAANAGRAAALAPIARHPWLTALAVIVVGVIVLLWLWDWNWFKGPIERQVQSRTGRELQIGGDLDVDLGWVPTIRADQVTFGNAAWSKQPTMASAQRVEFDIELRPLFRRNVRIPELRLSQPVLNLEVGPQRIGNWKFGEPGGMQPQFRRVWIDDGKLAFLDAARKTDIQVDVASAQPKGDETAPPITAKGGGSWEGNRFTVNGRAQSPLALRDRESPYRIDARASAGATHAHARGTLLDPLRLRDFDLKLALRGKNMEDLYPLIGVATPATGPYSLDGRFTRDLKNDRVTWHYDGFTGKVGDSDLAGSASVETGGKRPYLRANLTSKRLDFDDLAGFVGGAPQAGGGETTNPELAAKAARDKARPRMLPDTPYELHKLRAMDADVRWKAHRIDSPKLPLDDMDAHLKLEDGLLRLEPLNFGVAGGDIRSIIRMDAREATIRTRAQIAARGLNLPKLLPDVKLAQDAIGRIGGDITVTGSGNSIARMLASADGDIAVGMGRGQISNLLMELAGLDIAEALKFLIGKDRKVPVRCAFGDFAVSNGIMTTRALAFDTTDTILIGDGTISLRDETLDLRLRPRPKDRSLFVLRSPLLVSGTFKDPSFRPDLKRVGLRGAIALALGSIAPPAALLATIELGPGEDSNCGGRYAK
ncbi:AsmA family protein [Lysobacter koreensis]|uniref:AsmA family protein n=1 Tax=Lysobacter koreensis TaxID=266122 RepID=A0ABW2YRS1_9GAMM